ncbi:TlpA family protein disulfide reductase [Candidatus Pacearchaeota archaeon]|nr:MAG: TlpA family protein disulfide reductase [Candidatus Pacearchaeota archaeon]
MQMSTTLKIKKRTLWVIAVAVVLVVGFFFLKGNSRNEVSDVANNAIGAQVGNIALDFSLKDVSGNVVSLSQFKGKKVVLAFFATWCTPCQIEASRLKQVDDETGGEKFVVYQIGVDNRESEDDLRNFKNQFGNDDWIVGFGFDVAQKYNVRSLDTTLIIDENGKIVYRDNGVPASFEDLRKYLT